MQDDSRVAQALTAMRPAIAHVKCVSKFFFGDFGSKTGEDAAQLVMLNGAVAILLAIAPQHNKSRESDR